MGAAGLTCSSVEMTSGGVGIALDLDRVPVRETEMSAYEIMLSESQERMLMVLRPGHEDAARAVFEKWELDFAIVGETTDSGHLIVRQAGQVAADIPVAPLVAAAPEYDRPWRPTPKRPVLDPAHVAAPDDLGATLIGLIGAPDLASRRWVWEQYDHMVMADTVGRPGGDAAVVRVHGTERALAMTTDCTPRYVFADPVEGGRQAVAEAWRNLNAVGARPLAITNNLNFGNPERPEIMGQLVGAIEGMGEACRALEMPVVSGNVSLYNETHGKAILPTPVIGGVGLIENVHRRASIGFKAAGETVILLGETKGWLGCSLYLRDIVGRDDGAPPPVDLAAERRAGECVRGLVHGGLVSACHDVSDGGVLVALAEMAIAGGMGAEIDPPYGTVPRHAWLFGEDQGRYLLTAADAGPILSAAEAAGVPARTIGLTAGANLTVSGANPISVEQLAAAHEGWLPKYMAHS
jgi:phosphoribosylformylglycinamidine synthase